jgi:hypothetical protein
MLLQLMQREYAGMLVAPENGASFSPALHRPSLPVLPLPPPPMLEATRARACSSGYNVSVVVDLMSMGPDPCAFSAWVALLARCRVPTGCAHAGEGVVVRAVRIDLTIMKVASLRRNCFAAVFEKFFALQKVGPHRPLAFWRWHALTVPCPPTGWRDE